MPTRKKRPSRSFSVPKKIIVLVVIFGAATGIYFLVGRAPAKTATVNLIDHSNNPYPSAAAQENAGNNARKASPSTAAQTLDNGPTTSSTSGGGSTTSTPSISVLVTRAGVVGSDLEVGTQVTGATGGTCTLNVTQTGETTITKTATIVLQNNAYVCPVFDIPTSQFPNQGTWDVSVSIASNGAVASNDWGSVELSN